MRKRKLILGALAISLLSLAAMPSVMAEESAEIVYETRPTFTALDYVELGDYIGLEIESTAFTVTEDDVLTEAEALIRDSSVRETVDVVETGDEVNIDYVGTLDGVAFDGGTDEGYVLEIGSGTFIDGFEDGLIGANSGDIVELNLTFPENYANEELAGQETVFTVTINEIQRIPELTDETVSEVSSGLYTDVDSFLEYIRSGLEDEAAYYEEYYKQQAILYALEDCATITEYPEDLIQYTVEEFEEVYGDDYLSYYGYPDEESRRELAQEYVKSEMLLLAVAEAEDLSVTDEEYQDSLEKYAQNYGYDSGEEFENAYIAIYGEETLYNSILENKALTLLEENAVVTLVQED